jgi:hypothetical protein
VFVGEKIISVSVLLFGDPVLRIRLITLMRIPRLVYADPDPACHPDADADPDTDPGSQNDADPDADRDPLIHPHRNFLRIHRMILSGVLLSFGCRKAGGVCKCHGQLCQCFF